MKTLDRIWIGYLVAVLAVGLFTSGGGSPAHRPGLHLVVHGAVLVGHLLLMWHGRTASPRRRRIERCVTALVTVPIVFSGMAWLLPAVHPEPYEWIWIAWDRAIFGGDPTVKMQEWLSPLFTEVLHWVYASFYLIPIGAAITVGWSRGAAAFDRATCILVFGFLVSYLGYLLWPTLPPYRFLDHGPPLVGVWLTDSIHVALDQAEVNRWDCFPSGHTMLSLMSMLVLWRWARPGFFVFLTPVALLVFSTMALRYHFFCDVVAGALLALPAFWLCDWLMRRDEGSAGEQAQPPAAQRGLRGREA